MNQTFKENPYIILGVPTDAEEKEIKKAYRKLALKHHPDRCQDPTKIDEANQKFVQISQSYELLTTPRLRREWNRENGIANDYSGEMDESIRSTSTAGFGNSSHHRTYADPNEKYTPASTALSKVDKNAFSGKRIPGHKSKGGTSDNSPKPFQYQFSDPYEIWKRDFKDQFGFEYPGADYDFVSYDTPIIKPDHETQKKDKAALLAKNGIVDDGNFNKKDDFGNVAANNKKEKDKKDVKKVPFTFNPFNRKKKDNKNNTDDDDDDDDEDGNDGALVVYDEKTGKKKTTKSSKGTGNQLAIRNSKSKDETQLGDYKGSKNETQLSEYKGNDDNSNGGSHDNSAALVVSQGRNNRPVAMDVVTKTEGKVTTTITTITRPDGTTETMVMKTGLPKKKEDKKKQPPLAQLTNGEPDLLQLTNGDDPGNQLALVSPTPKKKPAVKNNLLLGNGGKQSPKKLANSNNDTSNDKALVVKSSTTSPNNNSSNTKSTTNNATHSSPKRLTSSTTTSSTSPPINSSKSSNNTNTNSMKALALTDGTTSSPTKKVASSNNPLLSSSNKTKAGTAGFVNPMLAGKKK